MSGCFIISAKESSWKFPENIQIIRCMDYSFKCRNIK
ncbi:hypothetical protein EVA_14672 [gut metagenome]|uniref:Uncharacterized protein n=1 Tax=gut metagenome TaxID=749906 RepID=J9G601_9ZZZZ